MGEASRRSRKGSSRIGRARRGGGALLDWKIFRDRVLARVRERGDARYARYVSGTSDRAWAHIRAEGCFSPEEAEERFFSFYLQDAPFLDE